MTLPMPPGATGSTANLMAPAFYLAKAAPLALFNSGVTTGLVVESGEGVSNITPVVEGYCRQDLMPHFEVTGSTLTDCLKKMISDKGYEIPDVERERLRALKETCWVAASNDYIDLKSSAAIPPAKISSFDTAVVNWKISSSRFLCPEVLFEPALAGLSSPGLHDAVHRSIMKCESTMRETMYERIVLVRAYPIPKPLAN